MKYDTKRICETNSLFDWLTRYGIEVDRKGFARCPFHSEKTASFRVYKDGTYHCFGCGAHGDVITFVMKMQNLSFQDTCQMLDRDITYSEQRKIQKIKKETAEKEIIRKKTKVLYWEAFDNWKENEDLIELFKPKSVEDIPNSIFLNALSRRGYLEYLLNLAEVSRGRDDILCSI